MTGSTVLITGGSRGIGKAIVEKAVSQGWSVALTYFSDEDSAASVVSRAKEKGGICAAYRCDAAGTKDAFDAMIDRAETEIGAISCLVNNVGITGRIGPLADLPEDTLRRTIDTNVTGTILMTQAMVTRWIERKAAGSVVNISSIAATLGAPNEYVHYAASKAAIEAFTIGLAKELGPAGIRINAVSPGTALTDIHARGGDPGRPERVAARVPLGRAARPEEIANAVMWLASPEASYASGAILRVGGGL